MQLFKKHSIDKARSAKSIGQSAEMAALRFLKKQGLILITKNFHSRHGEIDLIMQDNNILTFIEVRCRKFNAQVTASESVTPAKIKKITKTAEYYIMSLDVVPHCRFDVIAMTHNPQKSGYTIEWLKQAF